MASQHRKHRGYRTQKCVAEYLKRWFPYAESAGAGRQGSDILGVPFDIEVKARNDKSFQPKAWLDQTPLDFFHDAAFANECEEWQEPPLSLQP